MANDPNEKKEFTSILDLQKLQAENPEPVDLNAPVDPFAVNELQAIEQVNDFESIDQIGMMDHPEQTDDPFAVTAPAATVEDPFAVSAPEAPIEEPIAEDPFAVNSDFSNTETPASFDEKPAFEEAPLADEPITTAPPLNNVKNYSEKTQGRTNLEVKIHYPFHLKINGTFGPFERDKLLLFITENPIGITSAELDLQLKSGRVFFPRISEFAAVKLVQDLRDSGLSFTLHPSDQEPNQPAGASSALSFQYQNSETLVKNTTQIEIPILNSNAVQNLQKPFQEIDEVSIVQYVKTEVLEVENSPMIQEVIERMTEILKQKARLKGGSALLSLQQEILPLRLPSQYQISLRASVIKY